MLYRFSCKDMGLNCPFITKGETLEGVTQLAFEHIQKMHAQDFNLIRTAVEVEQMKKALARSTRVVAG